MTGRLLIIILLALTATQEALAQRCVQHGYLPDEAQLYDTGINCQPSTTTQILYGGPVGWSFQTAPCGESESETQMRECLINFWSKAYSCYRRTVHGPWQSTTGWGDAGSTPNGQLTLRRFDQTYTSYYADLDFSSGAPVCATNERPLVWGLYRTEYAYCPLGKSFYLWDYSDPERPMVCGDATPVVAACGQPNQLAFGNPVDLASGAKLHQETHIQGGSFAVQLGWFYRSDRQHSVSETKVVRPASSNGILGYADRVWRHSFDKQLIVDRTGFRPTARIVQPGGARDGYFTLTASGWRSSVFGKDALTESAGGWFYRSFDNVLDAYDSSGKLLGMYWPSGRQITFTYTSGLLAEAKNSFGVPVRFNYSSGTLSSIQDPAGRYVTYTFSPIARTLTNVSFQNATQRRFVYEAPSAQLLTGIIDEVGNRVGTYAYNQKTQRAISTEAALGTSRFGFTYRDPYNGPSHPVISTPLGGQAHTSWIGLGPNLRDGWYLPAAEFFAGVDAPYPGCEKLPRWSNPDANGNPLETFDFNNNKICYAYDLSRNLETKRVEGVTAAAVCSTALSSPPTGARLISTQWHADWRLETRIAEPKKLTTITYNGQGATCAPSTVLVDGKPPAVICTRTEQATTDETGAAGFAATVTGTARTWRYTYTTYGRVLTATDPNNRTTTTSHHPDNDANLGKRGNVASITNAANHVTYITDYNAHGQPTRIIDPNGVVTTLTYDPRMRLTSRTVGNEASVFGYDPVGQMTSVNLPDGARLTYTYDAAHRLTAINDHKGNRIDYTLDAMGNRLTEKTKDPGGVLVGNIARVIDALNRVQQVTGAGQ